MSKNDIIAKIYLDGIVQKIASRYYSKLKNYIEDFKMHIFEVLCLVPEEKLKTMYDNNELNFYIYYICKALAFNNNSDFWKTHKDKYIEYTLDDPNYQEKGDEDYE